MLLRPYTLVATGIVVQNLYFALYLIFGADRSDPDTRRINRLLALSLLAVNVLFLHHSLVNLSSDLIVDSSGLFRGTQVVIIFALFCEFLYSVLAQTTTRFETERRIVRVSVVALVLAELTITIVRAAPTWGDAIPSPRPLVLEFPILIAQFWLTTLVVRAWIFTDRQHQQTRGTRFRAPALYSLFRPQAPLARMLRNMTLAGLLALLIPAAILIPAQSDPPLWMRNMSDPAALLTCFVLSWSYLRYQLNQIGLGMRIVAGGLLIFLTLTSVLGWLISTVYLDMVLPGVPAEEIITSVADVRFVIPAAYLPAARGLDALLQPILWFQIGGSMFFIAAFWIYYRLQISRSVTEILHGIAQLRQGELAHRIPADLNDEFGDVAGAINAMAGTLHANERDLRTYQHELEGMVEERTAELAEEMERRRQIELHAAVLDERARIARDVHDGVLQNLYAVRMRLRSRRLRHGASGETAQELPQIADQVHASIRELRAVIDETNSDWHTLPLRDTAALIIRSHEQSYDTPIALSADRSLPPLPLADKIGVVRIMQEAVANIGQHSGATSASVTLSAENHTLTVRIEDDGVGFDPDRVQSGHRGVANMFARADELGGRLRIDSNPSADRRRPGTTVHLDLPLADPAEPLQSGVAAQSRGGVRDSAENRAT